MNAWSAAAVGDLKAITCMRCCPRANQVPLDNRAKNGHLERRGVSKCDRIVSEQDSQNKDAQKLGEEVRKGDFSVPPRLFSFSTHSLALSYARSKMSAGISNLDPRSRSAILMSEWWNAARGDGIVIERSAAAVCMVGGWQPYMKWEGTV